MEEHRIFRALEEELVAELTNLVAEPYYFEYPDGEVDPLSDPPAEAIYPPGPTAMFISNTALERIFQVLTFLNFFLIFF